MPRRAVVPSLAFLFLTGCGELIGSDDYRVEKNPDAGSVVSPKDGLVGPDSAPVFQIAGSGLQNARGQHGYGSRADVLYAANGIGPLDPAATLERMSGITGVWETVAIDSPLTPRSAGGMLAVLNIGRPLTLWLIGGRGKALGGPVTSIDEVELGEPSAVVRTRTFEQARWDACYALAGDPPKLYMLGGTFGDGFENAKDVVECTGLDWDEELQCKVVATWADSRGVRCVAVGQRIYLLGGFIGATQSQVDVFDTATYTFAKPVFLPHPVSSNGVLAIGHRIWSFGDYELQGRVMVFNTLTHESRAYDPVPSFVARRHAGVGVAGGKLWVFGGLRGGTSADVVEEVLEAPLQAFLP
ncbi:MAG: hypothetical protein IPM35_15140 [Myxococcales bacterium]|nr:hypothetical protein [Myxococcales bacterium]